MEITPRAEKLSVTEADLGGSRFHRVCLADSEFNDVNMADVKITNANLSDLEIFGAQIGGASFRGMVCRRKAIRRGVRIRASSARSNSSTASWLAAPLPSATCPTWPFRTVS